jgi:methionyl-tRNA formyltransferase
MLKGVVLLAGYTARAKAYVQALNQAGLVPEFAMLYGNPQSDRPGQGGDQLSQASAGGGIFLPDLSCSLTTTLDRIKWSWTVAGVDSVNDSVLIQQLRDQSHRLVMFCGYGGEIVSREALAAAPFLHVHSGWLPDFRGSTTGYYSWLEEGTLGASAIILNSEIDAGVILMRKRYPLPPRGIDMDYLWDPAIRADLLVRIMKKFAERGSLPHGVEQLNGEGRTFYVIHPVLKHLALLGQH